MDFEPNLGLWLRSDLGVTLNSTTAELLTDGDMEAVGTAAWGAFQSALTKELTNPYEGLQSLRVTAAVAATVPQAIQAILTVGKEYRVTGVARSDGTEVPRMRNSPQSPFIGTNSTAWQPIDETFTATHANVSANFQHAGAVGTEYCEFDDLSIMRTTAEDVTAWADQSGNARHVLQANATLQMAYSASGGPNNVPYIEGDGVQEYLKGTWVQAQPVTTFIVALPSIAGGKVAETLIDGSANDRNRHYFGGGGGAGAINAGAGLGYGVVAQTIWQYWTTISNGVSSSININGGTPVTGNAGANAPDGLTIGARGGISVPIDCRVAEIIQLIGVGSATAIGNIEHYIRTRYGL